MSVVVSVENLSKQYRLGTVGTGSLAHDINRWWHRARGKEDPYARIGEENDRVRKGNSEYVWALRDVSFEVKDGEVLGIVGRNGAGKSTLLKILSRTTTPTAGCVKVKGRVASLLEVGTGFHPELTGRENVFLNGAILGMSRQEIARKFDEIVDFSGVERYIDTPVKRYSSGMHVRLAFAVAAHLEPEILVVDEVLAVGDSEFQKKCLGKMRDVSARQGRTILFVSHNLGTILQLCRTSLLLKNGTLSAIGQSSDVVEQYYADNDRGNLLSQASSNKDIYVKEAYSCSHDGMPVSAFAHSEDIHLRIKIGVNRFDPIQNVGIAFLDAQKKRVFTANKTLADLYPGQGSEVTVDFVVGGGLIAPNRYSFLIALNSKTGLITYELLEDICGITVYDDGTDLAFAEGANYGCIIVKDRWNVISHDAEPAPVRE